MTKFRPRLCGTRRFLSFFGFDEKIQKKTKKLPSNANKEMNEWFQNVENVDFYEFHFVFIGFIKSTLI